jgi:acyl-[acyl-carrier-protein]-phospholipid O-acyltransferase/long-chain-fatty-acid--[acyl-carrier-protein] ligase
MSGAHSQFTLLKTQRFLPLFITQAIGAFNDNAFRFALSIVLVYDLGPRLGFDAGLTNTISAGLLTLPFFLFSALAGQLADKFDKAALTRRIKFIEILIVALASASLFTDNVWLQLACVFLTGTQSAFFGPIKYSILPQHLDRHELLGGNGLIEMGTFISVLLGTLFGSFFILHGAGRESVSAAMILLAVLAYLSARRIPPAPAPQPDLVINPNFIGETFRVVGQARERRDVFQSILGISWFWFLGVVFLTQIPLFASADLNGKDEVASFIVAVFTIGIGAGSLFCNRLLGGEVSVKYVPVAAILMTIFIIDLWFATGSARSTEAGGAPVMYFLSRASGWRVFIDLFLTSFCAGLFVVPLYAVAQMRTPLVRRARIIGANNIMNAIFMTIATVVSALLLKAGFSARGLFLLLGIANAFAAIYVIRLLPHDLIAAVSRQLHRLLYRVEVKGMENFEAAGRRAVIVANHTALIDGPILSAFLPERCTFAINTLMAQKWWVKPAFALYDLAPIDPGNPLALRTLVEALKRGQKVVIFPEGRLTVTGALMKVYEGPAAVAQMANAKILPVRIDGAQYSQTSLLRGKLRLRWFPKVTLTFLPPITLTSPPELRGAALREYQANRLYDVMSDMMFRTSKLDQTLFGALLDARAIHGRRKKIAEDIQRKPISYDRLVLGSFVLGRKIAAATHGQKTVGVLLPNALGAVLTFFGLHAFGRVPAMLNFSTGAINMSAACTAAEVRTIITSRRFIEVGEMQADIELLQKSNKIIYLEDVRDSVGLADKLFGLWGRFFPALALRSSGASSDPNAPAVILFTSGSEGVPKGVVLSHRNLQANRLQAAARVDFTEQDIVFNSLPMFHAFGLLGGTLLPLLSGLYTFFYPSPLHFKIVPELCYDTNATILFGTDTFLAGYAKNAHPYDFFNIRIVIAGAERLKPETRELWMEKFGVRILEAYGATECSPAVASNTPMHYRSGTVGRLLDQIEYRLEPVEGIAEGGRLFVRGPNVMLGYLRADNPGVLEPPAGGWHDTGDIVTVDENRFVTILGRVKRFSKIAGEMVSLTAVENWAQQVLQEPNTAVVAVPDKKKGEQLVLFTTREKVERKVLADGMKKLGASELMVPRNIINVKVLPVLGSGKTDYVTLNRMAREQVGA